MLLEAPSNIFIKMCHQKFLINAFWAANNFLFMNRKSEAKNENSI